MKKQLIISGIALAAILGGVTYFSSIPDKADAVLSGSVGADGRCVINVAGTSMSYACNQAYPGGSPVGGLGAGQVNCFNNGTCEYQVWGGLTYGGTISTETYFTDIHATAFLQNGGTTEQVNAIDGIYTACRNLIASKPSSGGD